MTLFEQRRIKNRIEGYAYSAQMMRKDIRWVFSDAFLFEFAGRLIPKSLRWVSFINIFCNNRIVFWLIFFGAIPILLISAIALKFRFDWSESGSYRGMSATGKDIFVGFGAAAELPILSWYRSERGSHPLYIESARTLRQWINVTSFDLLAVMLKKFYEGHITLRNLPLELRPLRIKLQWSLIKHVGLYSYWFCGFKKLNETNISGDVLFIHSGLSAFAAVDIGLNVKFIAHGLLRHSIVFPDFKEIQTMSEIEVEHVKNRCPDFNNVIRQTFRSLPKLKSTRDKRVLLLAAHGTYEELELLNDFLVSLPLSEFEIGYRPRKNNAYKVAKGTDFRNDVRILSSDGSLMQAISEFNPALVVSTVSAGLIEASNAGCTSVCLASVGDRVIIDMVYPMLDCFLKWPQDHQELSEMILRLNVPSKNK